MNQHLHSWLRRCFQFLGIPPKGELEFGSLVMNTLVLFPISRDPPEGGTYLIAAPYCDSRRDGFQFLGIPPKGEQHGDYPAR